MINYKARLTEFRQVLKKQKLDAFIIPNTDMWQSEHPQDKDKRLKYICGLDASAGYVVITKDEAVVLIDGRYTLAAKEQVDTSLFTIEYYTETYPEIWAIEHIRDHGVIGYDSWLHTRKEAKRMQKACNDMGVFLQPVTTNPVDTIWNDQPKDIEQAAIAHDLQFSGQDVDEKCVAVAKILDDNDADSTIITAPDSLAWLLNLRTIEPPETPGVKGFCIFEATNNRATIFTDVDMRAFDYGETDIFEIDFLPMEDFSMAIHYFEQRDQVVQIDEKSPDWLTEHLNAPASEVITRPDPCEILKAIKNPVEQDGIRNAHHRDAIAVKKTIDWIKNEKILSEKDVAQYLIGQRSQNNFYRGVSFDSIVGWNENGAKIHGIPTDTIIEGDGLLLIDSGGQYDDGTTDITRTIGMGTPSQDMREKFTIVLKAHIALAMAVFPKGTTGTQLDTIARKMMWDHGLNYAHGTGHGVGHFLNVHEGPCGISPRCETPLQAGMLLSNEPGYYEEGAFGIRHENLMLVQNHPEYDGFLHFETVTKVPFDESCIMGNMLCATEEEWLRQYHDDATK